MPPYVIVFSAVAILAIVLIGMIKYKKEMKEVDESESTKLHSIMTYLSTRTFENISAISKLELMVKLNIAPKDLKKYLDKLTSHSLIKDHGNQVSITEFGEKIRKAKESGESYFK